MKSTELVNSDLAKIENLAGDIPSANVSADSESKKVPVISIQKGRWLWEDWFQLIMIIALFTILLFPLWLFLYEIIFSRH